MKNVWKGLVLGGLTGAGVGLVVDLLAGSAAQAAKAKALVQQKAPDAAEWAEDVSRRAAEWLRHQELPERTRVLAERIVDSAPAERVREAATFAAHAVHLS